MLRQRPGGAWVRSGWIRVCRRGSGSPGHPYDVFAAIARGAARLASFRCRLRHGSWLTLHAGADAHGTWLCGIALWKKLAFDAGLPAPRESSTHLELLSTTACTGDGHSTMCRRLGTGRPRAHCGGSSVAVERYDAVELGALQVPPEARDRNPTIINVPEPVRQLDEMVVLNVVSVRSSSQEMPLLNAASPQLPHLRITSAMQYAPHF